MKIVAGDTVVVDWNMKIDGNKCEGQEWGEVKVQEIIEGAHGTYAIVADHPMCPVRVERCKKV